MIKKDFEKWYLSRFDGDIFWSLKDDCYIPIKAHYMWLAWQEMIERKQKVIDAMADKVDELTLKLDIKDDAICALNLALDHAVAENRRLKDSQENTIKMLREVLRMLDRFVHL